MITKPSAFTCLLTAALGMAVSPMLSADDVSPLGLTGEEFTSSSVTGTPPQYGYVRGTATRKDGGTAAWVAHTSTGGGTRVGLWDVSGSGDFTNPNNNVQTTTALGLTDGGLIYGLSNRYVGAVTQNQAAWVADASASNIETKRIGLTEGEFTAQNGTQYSTITPSASGAADITRYIAGTSRRYDGNTALTGQAVWIANVDTGLTTRVGYTGGAFTSDNQAESSTIASINSSGYFSGNSAMYLGNKTGVAAWVGNVSNPSALTRIGLWDTAVWGDEFTSDLGNQTSMASPAQGVTLTESGYLANTSARYNGGSTQLGQAAWVASAVTGITYRIGLWGEGYTALNQTQSSTIRYGLAGSAMPLLNNKGKVLGSSDRYNGIDNTKRGDAAWIADAATGVTTRLGLWDEDGTGVFTNHNGEQKTYLFNSSLVTNVPAINSDYVWGYSQRYDESGIGDATNRTAWVYNFVTDTQTAFEISVDSEGLSYSIVNGVTDGGIAFGSYTLFDGSTSSLNHAFFWGESFGVQDLNNLAADQLITGGWSSLTTITSATENGDLLTFIGQGVLTAGGTTQFTVTVDLSSIIIPEPSTWALIVASLIGAGAIWFRRRQAVKMGHG